jgi:hypothetical protein
MLPKAAFDVLESGFFVVEMRGGKERGRHDFSPVIGILRRFTGYVKYNIAKRKSLGRQDGGRKHTRT